MQWGKTALMEAAQYGHRDVVELLLGHGARIEHQTLVIRGDGWGGCGCEELLRGALCVEHGRGGSRWGTMYWFVSGRRLRVKMGL